MAREGLKQQRQQGNEDTIEGLNTLKAMSSNIHWVVEEDVEPCRHGSIHRLLQFSHLVNNRNLNLGSSFSKISA